MTKKPKKLWVVTEGSNSDVQLFTERPEYRHVPNAPYDGYDAWTDSNGRGEVFCMCGPEFRRATGIRLRKNTPTQIRVTVVGGKK